ncbi:ubiquitin 3 binding protein But2 C-terminal domain-containing protein [Camillea tinctor]|nr:ubiquitin 3 binding protein But2 C-terminal domain-containing protein [Camillea tinctor]
MLLRYGIIGVFPVSMAYVLTPRANAGCGFHLATKGSFDGAIGEIDSGQARAGSDISPSLFTWFGDAFVDRLSRGCWWTPPTSVLQCDYNQQPDHGFSIDCNGELSFNGQSTFYQCPTGDGDEVNIYLKPTNGNCAEITIQADDCRPPCSGTAQPSFSASPTAPPSAASPVPNNPSAQPTGPGTAHASPSTPSPSPPGATASPTPPSPTTITPFTSPTTAPSSPPSPSSAPTTPTGTSSTTTTTSCTTIGPSQIILIDKAHPDTAYGPNPDLHIQVSPNASSIFNFAFADADLGKTCELFLTLPPVFSNPGSPLPVPPESAQPQYFLTGTGPVDFAALDGWADPNTTYATAPRVARPLDAVLLRQRGTAWGFGRFACPGQAASTGILMGEAPYADTCLDCRQGQGDGEGGRGAGLWMEMCG